MPAASEASQTNTPNTPFYRLGGAEVFKAIGNRFYDLMEQDPAYGELRALHAKDLQPMRDSLHRFLAGWAGGPRDCFADNPGKCMVSLHKPMPITPQLAHQWAEAMQRAIADVAPQPADMAKAMGDALAHIAKTMVTKEATETTA